MKKLFLIMIEKIIYNTFNVFTNISYSLAYAHTQICKKILEEQES
jgi:hypothetical protein